jgi:hypothetical protein
MDGGFNMDNVAILLAVLPLPVKEPIAAVFLEVVEHPGFFFLWPEVEDGHLLELFPRITVYANRGLVHFQKSQRLPVNDPCGERIVAEEQPEHLFVLAQSILALRKTYAEQLRPAFCGGGDATST